ncbi:MAG: histidine kinase N-terminal 7TM domain-containing protein [Patescibacteria group bacterium]
MDLAVGLITAALGIGIYVLAKESRSAKLFSLICFSVSIWSLFVSINTFPLFTESTAFTFKFSYFLAATLGTQFVIFSILYPRDQKVGSRIVYGVILIEIILLYLISFTDLIISQPTISLEGNHVGWGYGPLWFIFDVYFSGCWLYGIYNLYKKIGQDEEKFSRRNLQFMLLAFIVGLIPPSITGIILPRIGIFEYNWSNPLSSLLWISIIAYSIIRYHLFSIKLIAIQLVTFSFWIFMLIRIFFAANRQELFIEVGILSISVILGITLIRSVLHEIKQRERIEGLVKDLKGAYANVKDLNDHLEQKVEAQTREVRASYEVEKRARQELLKLNETKNHFIGMAQHQLRTPVTGVKWQLEAILGDLSRKDNEEIREELEALAGSVKILTTTINKVTDIAEE